MKGPLSQVLELNRYNFAASLFNKHTELQCATVVTTGNETGQYIHTAGPLSILTFNLVVPSDPYVANTPPGGCARRANTHQTENNQQK